MLVTRLIPHSDSSISKMQNIHSKVDSTWQILNTKSEANSNSILMMRRSGSTWSYTVLQYTMKLPCQVTLVAHFECTLTPWQQTARHEQNTLFPPGVFLASLCVVRQKLPTHLEIAAFFCFTLTIFLSRFPHIDPTGETRKQQRRHNFPWILLTQMRCWTMFGGE